MKILFLYPNTAMVSRIPLGISYLAAYLKKDGHDIRLFDTTFIKCGKTRNDEDLRASSLQVHNPDLKKYGLVERDIDAAGLFEIEIEKFKPDLIAMSVVDPNYAFGLGLLKNIKKRHKDVLTAAGGPTATFAPEEVIGEDCVDIICVGEGEMAMRELCNRIERREDIKDIKNIWVKENEKVYKNAARPLIDVNELPSPEWDIFDQRHLLRPLGGRIYRMGLFAMTRGCLFPCRYCGNLALLQIYKGQKEFYRIRKVESLIQEITSYKKKYNLNFVFFADDIFPLHKEETLDDFCRRYKEQVALPFSINLHPGLIKEELFAKIVDAGCRNICVGLESGSPKIREEVLGRHYKNEQIIHVFNLARKYKIRSSSFNMIGLPHEKRSDIFETIELNRRSRPSSATLSFFHPYRGTKLRELCINENLFTLSKEKEYEDVSRTISCLDLPQISKETLEGLFRTFQMYIKLPKILHGLIRMAEKKAVFGNFIYNTLKMIFYIVSYKELEWNFTKKSSTPIEEKFNGQKSAPEFL